MAGSADKTVSIWKPVKGMRTVLRKSTTMFLYVPISWLENFMTEKVKQKWKVHNERGSYSNVSANLDDFYTLIHRLWIIANIKCSAKVVEAILKQGKVGLDSGDPSILGIPSTYSEMGLDFKR